MKLRVRIVILLIMSFLNMGYSCNILSYVDSFYNLETNVREKSDFVENAVEAKYKTKNKTYIEYEKIDKAFSSLGFNKGDSDSSDNLIFYKDKQRIEVNQWKENNNSYINITIYNKNSKYKTVDLRKILYKIDDKNLVLNECYSYYKGKSDGNIIGELNDEGILRSSNLIKISNGYTGIANLNADEKINFAEIKYDTGSYIIIATPIIFTTY